MKTRPNLPSGITWVLGAPDPEMSRIEAMLREHGETVEYATNSSRHRVTPGTAYAARLWDAHSDPVIYVECYTGGEGLSVDHHKKGDAGFGAPPAEYMEASSLGQVLALLNIKPNRLDRVVAAGDHCPGAAYRGECPGVDPDVLMRWRAQTRAEFQQRTVAAVIADVEAAMARITTAGPHPAGVGIRDLRGPIIVELPEAALRLDIAYAAGPLIDDRDKRTKWVLGAASPVQVLAWQTWAAATLTDIYGDPARGFAGGYTPVKKNGGWEHHTI